MNRIDQEILNINKVIFRNIETIDSSERGFLSQNILSQLRNFIEHICLKFYSPDHDIENTYPNIQDAISFVKSRGTLKLLSSFHKQLQITASHYTPDEENSERLMLKYYEYLIKIKLLLKSIFDLDVLENLQNFPIKTDSHLNEYYAKIAEKINQPNVGRRKSAYDDRYYIQKIKPFFIGLKIYYEVTFTRAIDNVSKFERIIAFTKHDILHNYSVRFTVSNDSIDILGKNMPIQIIDDWEVSIRPCEINNFAKIFGESRQIGSLNESYALMEYLTSTGLNVVELIDFSDNEFAKMKLQISQHAKVTHFINILERCRQLTQRNLPGCNVIRYLLYRLNNRIIKNQYSTEEWGKISDLNLKWGCIPFDKMPFNSSPINHNPKILDLFSCINPDDRQHELLARFIRNNTEKKGQLYTHEEELNYYENARGLIDTWNNNLYYKHPNRKIESYKKHYFIKEHEEDTCDIIKIIQKFSSCGVRNYKNTTESWFNESTHEIDCVEKRNALSQMFENSHVALIYGAAGTGKSTMINHISNRYNDSRKLYLANTNPAVHNLKRKVNAKHCTYMTIAKFLRDYETDYDLLIIDECSAVNNSNMIKVLKKASFKLLILVGDIFQIESILFGNWFSLAKYFVPETAVSELTIPYRTKNTNLLTLWKRVRDLEDNILECMARNGYCHTLDDSIFEPAKDDEIVLCLNYDGLYGINNINRFLQGSNTNPEIEWGTHTYKVNDPVLFNETDRFSPLIHNNLKGKIAGIKTGEDAIGFDIEIDKVIDEMDANRYDFELMDDAENGNSIIRFSVGKHKSTDYDDIHTDTIMPFQVAYAVSIHKAQGLEYNSVKVVISDEVEDMISHNIFYTAITRAREKLKIYWTPEAEHNILSSFEKKAVKKDMYLLKSKYNL